MRNTVYLTLIFLLLLTGLSCTSKKDFEWQYSKSERRLEVARLEALRDLVKMFEKFYHQLPELPDYKNKPWQECDEGQEKKLGKPKFFLGGRKVKFPFHRYFYHKDIIEDGLSHHDHSWVEVIQNVKGQEWLAVFYTDRDLWLKSGLSLYEFNEKNGGWNPIQNFLNRTDLDARLKERYDLEVKRK